MRFSIDMSHSTRSSTIPLSIIRPLRLIMLAALITAVMLVTMIAPSPHVAQQAEPCEPDCFRDTRQGCFASQQTDIVFIVDASRTIAQRGQTYNIELEGIIRALEDPGVIPRDGSTAVSVITFNRGAEVRVPLTQIISAAGAAAVAAQVQALKCANIGSPVSPCPVDDTDYNAAIGVASSHINQSRPGGHPRFNARRIMILISDGTPELGDGVSAATQARNDAATLGVKLELDAFLVGVSTGSPEFAANKAALDQLLFRVPANAGTGKSFVINAGTCNDPGATFAGDDCNRQATEVATNTRSIIRADVLSLNLVVNTDADAVADTPGTVGPLTLRQAIDRANCNGGNATITFAESVRGMTIRPLTPLPAITQPDITIDGCVGDNCTPAVTIDGADTGEADVGNHCDGILIRSSGAKVRGLRIINFKRAGVAISPCSFDGYGNNLVELNTLENNAVAGVLVCDPAPPIVDISLQSEDFTIQQTFSPHNEGNKISRNAISGSATPIDLGCDEATRGATPNDAGDTDVGPNTLLNFPNQLNAVAEGNAVRVSGQLAGPTVAGAKVEIFAVTDFRVESGNVIIEAVSFLAEATADEAGNFTVAGVTPSPTGIYSATVTDRFMNTSELMTDPGLPQPRANIAVGPSIGNIDITSQPREQQFVITNTGTAPLVINCAALVASCTATPPGTPDPRFTVIGCPTAPINPTTGPNDLTNRAVISVRFTPNPAGFTGNPCGPAAVCFRVNTNDPSQPQVANTVNVNVTGTTQPTVSATQFTFKRVNATPTGRKMRSASFTVGNNGCADLVLTFGSILRLGNDVSDNRRDDTRFFSVAVNGVAFGPGSTVTIPRGSSRTFTVTFTPVIPAVSNCKSQGPLAASEVLPDEVMSVLTINTNTGSPIFINLLGRVRGGVRLINPTNPAGDPVVILTRSGDEFTVEFSVYDADLTVNTATFEFLASNGTFIGQPIIVNLRDSLPGCLAKGQSFTVTQRFTGAQANRNAVQVRVTVSDGTSSAVAFSNVISPANVQRAKSKQ